LYIDPLSGTVLVLLNLYRHINRWRVMSEHGDVNRKLFVVSVRYHEDGSKELNICSLCIFFMVYYLNTDYLIIYESYITAFTR
jgi:hypothetical protein